MSINVPLKTLLESQQVLVQLANAPFHPKLKYWVGHILAKVQSATAEYERKRVALVKKLGDPVKYEPQPPLTVNGQQVPQNPKRVVLTDPKEIALPNTSWDIPSGEAMDKFMAEVDKLQAEAVHIPFEKLRLSAFGDDPTPVNMGALDWMIEGDA